jgi:hypothetical protein
MGSPHQSKPVRQPLHLAHTAARTNPPPRDQPVKRRQPACPQRRHRRNRLRPCSGPIVSHHPTTCDLVTDWQAASDTHAALACGRSRFAVIGALIAAAVSFAGSDRVAWHSTHRDFDCNPTLLAIARSPNITAQQRNNAPTLAGLFKLARGSPICAMPWRRGPAYRPSRQAVRITGRALN